MAKLDLSWLTPKGSVSEAKRRASADAAQRKAAETAPRSVILRTEDVRGEYDAGRALKTTLGGKAREITLADLQAYRENMRRLQGRISSSGITAQQVLELSKVNPLTSPVTEKTDLDRSRDQIRMAVPTFAHVTNASGRQVLDMRFMTNSGPGSKRAQHHVHVRFLGFDAAIRSIAATPAEPGEKPEKGAVTLPQAIRQVQQGYLAFDCDCERHRYVFRYVTSIGGFNAGRDETGYPKIRNPKLDGVACKHVLRAMGEIHSSRAVGKFIGDALTKAARKEKVAIQVKQADARALAAKQNRRPRDLEVLARKAEAKMTEMAKTHPPRRGTAAARVGKAFSEGRIEDALLEIERLGIQLSQADKARIKSTLENQ